MTGPTGRGRNTVTREDSYEPGTLEQAWAEYRTENPQHNNPDGYAAFRAGFRRGVSQGAVLSATTFFHSASETHDRPPTPTGETND